MFLMAAPIQMAKPKGALKKGFIQRVLGSFRSGISLKVLLSRYLESFMSN